MMSTDVHDGVLERLDDGRRRLRFERLLAHPVERVWAALTQPGGLGGWWGDAEVDLREGGEFVMRWRNTDPQGNHPVMHATITALDPPRLLEVSGDLHGVLRWELEPAGARCDAPALQQHAGDLRRPCGERPGRLALAPRRAVRGARRAPG